ncbi:hypothetical protein COOONC_00797 [Cooperia oncophora]
MVSLLKPEISDFSPKLLGNTEESPYVRSRCDEASGRHLVLLAASDVKDSSDELFVLERTTFAAMIRSVESIKVSNNCLDETFVVRADFKNVSTWEWKPDAIRPDRDKTGRQKNPRRNGTHLINGLDPAVVKKLSGASMFGDLPCVNKRDDSDDNPTSPSSRAESAPAVDVRPNPCDEILTTLREIEQICLQLRDVAPVSPMARPTLLDCVHRPSLITPRSQMVFEALNGPANLAVIAENVRRMTVLVFDYANTLKPIADIQPEEKVTLWACFSASFVFFSSEQFWPCFSVQT